MELVRYSIDAVLTQFRSAMSWSTMARDVLAQIMLFLDPMDTVRSGRVCRAWRAASESDALWQKLCAAEGIVASSPGNHKSAYLYAACTAFRTSRMELIGAELLRLSDGPLLTLMDSTTCEQATMLLDAAVRAWPYMSCDAAC